jgi:hypothetical protein
MAQDYLAGQPGTARAGRLRVVRRFDALASQPASGAHPSTRGRCSAPSSLGTASVRCSLAPAVRPARSTGTRERTRPPREAGSWRPPALPPPAQAIRSRSPLLRKCEAAKKFNRRRPLGSMVLSPPDSLRRLPGRKLAGALADLTRFPLGGDRPIASDVRATPIAGRAFHNASQVGFAGSTHSAGA